jgi:porin
VQVQNQLPAGSINLGGFITSENGDGVYGTVTWRSGLPLGLDDRLWVGGSYTPDSAQVIATSFIAGGVVIQGPLPGRPLDVALLGIGRGGLSNQLSTSPYEGMLELGYKIQLNESLNLQPTLQWIFNPSGASEPVPGILAAGMQIELNF